MPNLLGNPHSISVHGLCTMLIVSIHSPMDAHCNLHLQHSCWKLHLIRNDQLTVTICLPVRFIFSKEVIRPQVPLRPPCYDFSPLA